MKELTRWISESKLIDLLRGDVVDVHVTPTKDCVCDHKIIIRYEDPVAQRPGALVGKRVRHITRGECIVVGDLRLSEKPNKEEGSLICVLDNEMWVSCTVDELENV